MLARSAKATLIVLVSTLLAAPAYARGFAGGFHGGSYGGFHGGSYGGFHGDSFGGYHGASSYGGYHGASSYGNYTNRGSFTGDGGFGKVSGFQNRTPGQFNQGNLNTQGHNVRNSFNNDNFTHNTNNYNVNRYGGYGGYGGYHGYGGYGYHGYGYHPYGYGYGGWGGYPGWGWYGMSSAAMWTCMGMSSLGTFLGMASLANSGKNSQPVSSTNVTYEGDNVYINGQPSGTAGDYYQQAQQLAQTGQNYQPATYVNTDDQSQTADYTQSQNQQWAPLGVFALAEPGENQSNMILQLAINKDGIVRGNYVNQLTNETAQVYGALDKNTQRISWTIGTNPNTVFDASIGDLVKDDSSVLVHYGANDTSRMALIRLPQPNSSNQPGQNGVPPTAPSFSAS